MGSYINKNLRFLRKNAGMTQEQFASMIGIKRSLLGAYEEGRAEPNLSSLLRFADILSLPVQDLIARDLSFLKDSGSNIKFYNSENSSDEIPLVQQKAAAGYSSAYGDPEYLASLPVLKLPMVRESNLRAFELTGDSMLPLLSGTIIIASYCDTLAIPDGTCCIVATRDEGIVYKRVYNEIKENGTLKLISDNPAYKPYNIPASEILELWVAKAYVSMELPSSENIHIS